MKPKKRLLSLLLSCMLIFSFLPQPVLAEEGKTDSAQTSETGDTRTDATGLCEHHPEHTAECGYNPGTPEIPCSHEHTEMCYTTVTKCTHKHTEVCYPKEGAAESAEESIDTADGSSIPEAVGEILPTECNHECSEESGCIRKKLACQHMHDAGCGYVPGVPAAPCSYVCEICKDKTEETCICKTLCHKDAFNADCPVCRAGGEALGGCKGEPEKRRMAMSNGAGPQIGYASVDADTYYKVDGDGKLSEGTADDYQVYYSGSTLTINNLVMAGTTLKVPENTTIKVLGTNTIETNTKAIEGAGDIYFEGDGILTASSESRSVVEAMGTGRVCIQGSVHLFLNHKGATTCVSTGTGDIIIGGSAQVAFDPNQGGSTQTGSAIYSFNGINIIIQDQAQVTSTGGFGTLGTNSVTGTYGKITMKDSAVVNITQPRADTVCLNSKGGIEVLGNAQLNITNAKQAISTEEDSPVVIEGRVGITGVADEVTAIFCGSLNITGALSVEGGNSGIQAITGGVAVDGGNLTLSGNNVGIMFIRSGDLEVKNGVVDISSDNYGIVYHSLFGSQDSTAKITDSDFEVYGGTAAFFDQTKKLGMKPVLNYAGGYAVYAGESAETAQSVAPGSLTGEVYTGNKYIRTEAGEHAHCVCGKTDCTDHGNDLTWKCFPADFTGGALPAGNYFLMEEVTLSDLVTLEGDVNLCLNGNTLHAKQISGGTHTLSICDCVGNGKMEGSSGMIESSNGTVNIYGGELTTEGWPPAIRMFSGTLNLYGGTVSQISVLENEESAVFNAWGGTVTDLVSMEYGTANISGGTFAGLQIDSGTLNLSAQPVIQNSICMASDIQTISVSGYTGGPVQIQVNESMSDEGDVVVQGVDDSNASLFSLTNTGKVLLRKDGTLRLHTHKGSAPTCISAAVCGICGAEYGEKNPDNHDLVHHEAQAETCTAIGWKAYDTCQRKGCGYTTYVEIPAAGHKYVHHDKVAATHKADGMAEHHTCKNCRQFFDADKNETTQEALVLEMLDHTFGKEWKSDEKQHWHECECGEKSSLFNHTFEWVTDKEAQIGAAGSKHEECKICGYKKAAEEIPALDAPSYPPVITKPEGGLVSVDNPNPKPGEKVNVLPKPDSGYKVDRVVVKDKDGKDVSVKDNGDGTYSYIQPDGKVTIKVEFSKESETKPETKPTETDKPSKPGTTDKKPDKNADSPKMGDSSKLMLGFVLMLVSAGAVVGILVYSRRKKKYDK